MIGGLAPCTFVVGMQSGFMHTTWVAFVLVLALQRVLRVKSSLLICAIPVTGVELSIKNQVPRFRFCLQYITLMEIALGMNVFR
jgi:hypothetical protein